MIIDYDFRGKRVTIVGGGHETTRKVRAFVEAGSEVRLLGPAFDPEAMSAAKELGVPIRRCGEDELPRLVFESAEIVVVIADGGSLGEELRAEATRRRVLLYVGDQPEVSDWIQPAVRRTGPIQVAVSTGGASPIVARTLAARLLRAIRKEDRLEVEIQAYARTLARETISEPPARRAILYRVHRDPDLRVALTKGDEATARARVRFVVLRRTKRAAEAPAGPSPANGRTGRIRRPRPTDAYGSPRDRSEADR